MIRPASDDEFWSAFKKLYKISNDGRGVHVIQQGLALAAHDQEALEMFVPSAYIPMFRLFGDDVLKAAVPMLQSRDKAQRKMAEDLIRGFMSPQCQWITEENVSDYFRYECAEAPHRLVEFLYSFAPSTALLALDRAYPDQHRHPVILLADREIADAIWRRQNELLNDEVLAAAKEQLKVLRDRAEWWAQLYAKEIVRQHPWLGG